MDERKSADAPREWDGAGYHQVSEPQAAWGRAVLGRLAVCEDAWVLDAGCGSGRVTAELLARVPRGGVWAVDQSAQMLDQARVHLEPLAPGRVRYLQADLTTLQLPEPVDAVFSTATFHWIRDHASLFASLFKALKPGGVLVAQCGGEGNLARVRRCARTVALREPFAPWFQGFAQPQHYAAAEETARLLEAAGFVEVQVGLTPAPTAFESREALGRFLEVVTLRAELARLPVAELRAAYVSAVLDELGGESAALSLDYVRLDLEARRP